MLLNLIIVLRGVASILSTLLVGHYILFLYSNQHKKKIGLIIWTINTDHCYLVVWRVTSSPTVSGQLCSAVRLKCSLLDETPLTWGNATVSLHCHKACGLGLVCLDPKYHELWNQGNSETDLVTGKIANYNNNSHTLSFITNTFKVQSISGLLNCTKKKISILRKY